MAIRSLLRPKWWWTVGWMRLAGTGRVGRFASRMAALAAPPYKGRRYLAGLHPLGYVSAKAEIHGVLLDRGPHVFVGDGVVLHGAADAPGVLRLGEGAHLHRGVIVEMGAGGGVEIGAGTHIQPHCIIASFESPIHIGEGVQIAARCSFYSYDHGFEAGIPMAAQPLQSKGPMVIEDDVWLGVGVSVLDGVRIGKGAVVGAGAVVTKDIPENAIAVGVPAKVVGTRPGKQA